ncbi:hypothetical protein A8F94_19175 [Bacillus sp. FJAT-27225]|nr:hypothetical protein A8F94_19175 [Bacillus sp. FJAT-27225]
MKILKTLLIIVIATTLILTPTTSSLSRTLGNGLNTESSLSPIDILGIVDIALLKDSTLNVLYKADTGELVVGLKGWTALEVNLISLQIFAFQLPEELDFILEHPQLLNYTKIDLRLNGLLWDTLTEENIKKDLNIRTLYGSKVSPLLGVGLNMEATLTINLKSLGITNLPGSSDWFYEFYGVALKDSWASIEIFTNIGAVDYLLLPPILDTITDLDTHITGIGYPGATVTLNLPKEVYIGNVSEDGTFNLSIPQQSAGTVIVASQKDSITQKESHGTSTKVIGTLRMEAPPDINFMETVMEKREVIIKRETGDYSLKIRDTRGSGSKWRIKASTPNPLTSIEGHTLPMGAIVFIDDGKTLPMSDEVLIFEGETFNDPDTTIKWNQEEGIFIKINPAGALPNTQYSTTIHWTLEDAP